MRIQAVVLATLWFGVGCSSGDGSGTERTLTIEVAGSGTTEPAPGVYHFKKGTTVTVKASPSSGYIMRGWAGDASGSASELQIRLDADRAVTALFTLPNWPVGPAATYDNPVLPGNHADLNLFIDGNDFYIVGSNFAMFPALEILHSTDLLHWERTSRVVDAAAPALDGLTDPGEGTWGAFITRKQPTGYRIYFAINGTQWFAEANSLSGPWSLPTKVNSFPVSPNGEYFVDRGTGSDNSVFVDPDSGKTYMVTKNGIGQWDPDAPDDFFGMNRVVEIDRETGQLVPESMINLDFVNYDKDKGGGGFRPINYGQWAEGPTLTKRGDWYYYFVQTHTACDGNTNVWASRTLDGDPSHWHWLGFPAKQLDPYRGAQHPTAPFQIADGSWWVFEHSYDCTNKGDATKTGEWLGLGREGLLHQVTWVDTNVDGETIPVPQIDKQTRNIPAPKLTQSATPFLIPVNDDFSANALGTAWTTYDRMGGQLSVADGALTIAPAAASTVWALQKDALRSTTSLVKVEFIPKTEGSAAGVSLRNGYWEDQQVLSAPTWIEGEGLIAGIHDVQVARAMIEGKDVIRFAYRMRRPVPTGGSGSYSELAEPVVVSHTLATPEPAKAAVWLKLVRSGHQATGWVSSDRLTWKQVGAAIDISALDNHYGMSGTWIGSQVGMFATAQSARFDLFSYRDGLSTIPAIATDQQSGTAIVASTAHGRVLGDLQNDDWALYAGVDLGSGGVASTKARFEASSVGGGWVEVWLDPLGGGKHYGPCRIADTAGWEKFATSTCDMETTSGTHDVYIKVVGEPNRELLRLASLQFTP
ncbi:MAG: family 43 glycosylhydrolase [Myxococcota bacterium]